LLADKLSRRVPARLWNGNSMGKTFFAEATKRAAKDFYTPVKSTNVDRIVDSRLIDDRLRIDNAIFKKAGSNGKLKADAF
jgi:hypothetical protein